MADLSFDLLTSPPAACFSCGVATIDQTVKESYILVLLHRCFAYSVIAEGKLLGYYMISLRQFPLMAFDSPVSDYLVEPYHDTYAVHINYIAVQKEFQRHKIGTAILKHILHKAKELKQFCPVRLITMDALTELVPWYEKHHFRKSNFSNTDALSTTLMYYDMISVEEIKQLEESAGY